MGLLNYLRVTMDRSLMAATLRKSCELEGHVIYSHVKSIFL